MPCRSYSNSTRRSRPSAGGSSGWQRDRACSLGLLIGADDVVVLSQLLALPHPLIQAEHPTGLDGEVRVAWEDPRPVAPALDRIRGQPPPRQAPSVLTGLVHRDRVRVRVADPARRRYEQRCGTPRAVTVGTAGSEVDDPATVCPSSFIRPSSVRRAGRGGRPLLAACRQACSSARRARHRPTAGTSPGSCSSAAATRATTRRAASCSPGLASTGSRRGRIPPGAASRRRSRCPRPRTGVPARRAGADGRRTPPPGRRRARVRRVELGPARDREGEQRRRAGTDGGGHETRLPAAVDEEPGRDRPAQLRSRSPEAMRRS